ncbi:MAG: diaminopimelate epimerase [Candidatus Omnitrophica bacterium]|nr:diaminopimelate epimerase [Candidatus Omnitrophota bacterium]
MVFTKAVGSGNDFIIIDSRLEKIPNPAKMAQDLCRRHLSVGADGMLLLEKATLKGSHYEKSTTGKTKASHYEKNQAEYRMRIFNPDGSEAEMCGNGLRCFLLYLVRKGLSEAEHFIAVETKAGLRRGKVKGNFVTASLGEPREPTLSFPLDVDGRQFTANFVNTGVPHTIIEVEDLENFPVKELGRKIRFHPKFASAGANVDFVKIKNNLILIRTYERGVEDETLSCGTGTAAAGFLLRQLGKILLPVKVQAASGEILTVSEQDKEIFIAGEVRIVYEGTLPG